MYCIVYDPWFLQLTLFYFPVSSSGHLFIPRFVFYHMDSTAVSCLEVLSNSLSNFFPASTLFLIVCLNSILFASYPPFLVSFTRMSAYNVLWSERTSASGSVFTFLTIFLNLCFWNADTVYLWTSRPRKKNIPPSIGQDLNAGWIFTVACEWRRAHTVRLDA